MRLLLVEDDVKLVKALQRGLQREGYAVDLAGTGDDALAQAGIYDYDAVVLDVMLPGKDGFAVCRELRRNEQWVPVLMLTARDPAKDRIRGLDAGADDYLAKPFEYAELLARVKALLRRSAITAGSSTMRVRDLTVNPVTRVVERAGKVIELTQKEYALLEYLVRNSGRVVSRQMISEHVWKHDADPLTNVVDVYINYLRKKLDEDRNNPLIHTVRGHGYLIKE
jgi:DNA-binding response OmpR family regulator